MQIEANTIPEFFKWYREKFNFSQAQLAGILDVTPQYINNIESGRHPRPKTVAVKLLQHLEGKPKAFLEQLIFDADYQFSMTKIKGRKRGSQKRDKPRSHSA